MAQCELAVGDMQDRLDEIEQITKDTARGMAELNEVLKNS